MHAPASKASPELGSKEQHLGDYSNFLKNMFVNDKSDWHDILFSCVIRTQACTNLAGDSKLQTAADFYTKNLSPIESGCCKPPIGCRFEYVNATFWTATASGAAVYDSDCFNWRNEQKTLCYNCDSCEAGILEYARKDLRIWAIVNLVLVLFLFGAWLALLFSLEEEEETLELH
ncbi:tetraspanin-4-like [Pistacia vera]|uniref:tetraspanin-4-like n=1 Tax=Pistacia vera TaxID=55513 RepID=UPI001263E5B2|nr:tetraspanin-4-like [Pistacia vera]